MSYPNKYILPKGTITPNLGNINSSILQSVYKQNIVACSKIGNIGNSSTNGNTGPSGNIGDIGKSGLTGPNGNNGHFGPNGINGSNNGITGSTGPKGLYYTVTFTENDVYYTGLTTYFNNINNNWRQVSYINLTNPGFYIIIAKFKITNISDISPITTMPGLQLGISKNSGNGQTNNNYSEIGGSNGQFTTYPLNTNKGHFFCYECSVLYEATTSINLYLNLYNSIINSDVYFSIDSDTFSFIAHKINILS